MTVDIVRGVLGWCSIINMGVLIFWFLGLVFAHDWVYRMHNKFFKIPVETFNAIHYAGGMCFKLFVFIFNVIPYFALLIVTK